MDTLVYRSRMALIGLNQSSLAKLLGVSANTVSAQLSRPTVSKIYELALAGIEAQQTINLNK